MVVVDSSWSKTPFVQVRMTLTLSPIEVNCRGTYEKELIIISLCFSSDKECHKHGLWQFSSPTSGGGSAPCAPAYHTDVVPTVSSMSAPVINMPPSLLSRSPQSRQCQVQWLWTCFINLTYHVISVRYSSSVNLCYWTWLTMYVVTLVIFTSATSIIQWALLGLHRCSSSSSSSSVPSQNHKLFFSACSKAATINRLKLINRLLK